MAAPSPWPSRAVGDPVVRRHHTSEAEVGAPLIPLLDLIGQCPSREGAPASRFTPVHRLATVISTLLPSGGHFHHWGLGFKQSSLHHVGRVERNLRYSLFPQLRPSPSMLLFR